MTVKEFIDLLYTCDFDAEVYISRNDREILAMQLVKENKTVTSLNDVSQVEIYRKVIII